jgi:aquaporin Z
LVFRKLAAEFFGTFWLVLAVLGTAILAAGVPDVGVGWFGVAIAAGLAVLTMAYAVGGISGGHFNPAVSLGLAIAGRFAWADLIGYWIAQILGGAVAAVVVYVIASSVTGFAAGGFGANGYADLSPGGYSLLAALIAEIVLTGMFLIVILGATSKSAPAGFAPLAIGLCLTVIHLIGIPIDNLSVNPARSIASAIFATTGAWAQIWLFVVGPLVGGALGGVIWRYVLSPGESPGNIGQVK